MSDINDIPALDLRDIFRILGMIPGRNQELTFRLVDEQTLQMVMRCKDFPTFGGEAHSVFTVQRIELEFVRVPTHLAQFAFQSTLQKLRDVRPYSG